MSPLAAGLLVAFVTSLSLAAFAYVLYPALLSALARFASSRDDPTLADDDLPTVSLIIAAYNEEDVIERKIANSLELDYPDEKLDVVVFSDASSDGTDDVVRSYADRGVTLERIEGRVGKTECQNRVAERVDGEILVFSDANAMYESDAVRRIVSRFTDGVGCVVGELRHTTADDDVAGESVYWRYRRLIKRLESAVGSVVIGNGAIYAVRREDFVPLHPDLTSDFAEPLAIRQRGKSVKYAPDAVAWERTAGSVDVECSRKIRIATRSWHTVREYLGLMNPVEYGFYALALVSNTVLWWSTPLLFGTAFASATALAVATGRSVFALVVLGYAVVVALGLVGRYLDRREESVPSVFHIPHYFLVGNYSLVVGGLNFVRGQNIVTWETTNE